MKSLADIWHCSADEASSTARDLAEISVSEQRGDKDAPIFWVPLLNREALNLVQGTAE